MNLETSSAIQSAFAGVDEHVIRGLAIDITKYATPARREAIGVFSWLLKNPSELRRVIAEFRSSESSTLMELKGLER